MPYLQLSPIDKTAEDTAFVELCSQLPDGLDDIAKEEEEEDVKKVSILVRSYYYDDDASGGYLSS